MIPFNQLEIKPFLIYKTSLDIAQETGKKHFLVLAKIVELLSTKELLTGQFKREYYRDLQNKKRPMFELNEAGFMLAKPFLYKTTETKL